MKNFITAAFIFFQCTSSLAQWNYPATKTVDSSETYFGVTYKDPYRMLEHVKDSEIAAWYKQQSDYTDAVLDKISGRDELVKEWEKLDKLQPPGIHGRSYEGGRIFYKKTMPGENVGKIYYRQGMIGKEILLFDPLNFMPGKKLTVETAVPSFDGKKIAIAYSQRGAEVATIIVMDVDTKKVYPEKIYPVIGGISSWTFDNKYFMYDLKKTGDNTSPDFELHEKTMLHKVGDDMKSDKDIFSDSTYPDLGIAANEEPIAFVDEQSGNYIFANRSTVQSEIFEYYASVSEMQSGKINWKVLCTPDDKLVRGLEIIGDDAYAITYNGAKNYKLIYTNLKNPDWKNAKTVIEEKGETLESITHSRHYLYLVYSNGINNHIYKYDLTTHKAEQIKMPYSGTANIFCLDKKTDNCIVAITSWNRPFTEFNYNGGTNIFTPSIFNKPANYPAAYKNLEVKEVEVKGYDGAIIPLSIIYKKGTKLDGSNCCIMEGYGSYGYSYAPYFDVLYNALATRGVVIGIAHVRGGSEKGEAWYRAGFKTTKPNTWKDFISCAEYLVDKGYTSTSKLAGTGTSAGGILISRAITERPDLFAAAICNVGSANAMRGEFAPNGPSNTPEFGTVKDSVECRALYEMDGMQHVVVGTKYPALLGVAGWNDPRVIAWEPGKFVAAVQNATSSGKPVLMKINFDDGHFTEDKSVTYKNFANQYAFALWQCGHPGFQLKK